MVSLKDIARKANVSINTVSRVLNGKTKEVWRGTSERADNIRRIASELGYRPNAAARAMCSSRTNNVGILMSGAYSSEYEFPVIMGINKRLYEAGKSVSLINAELIDPDKPETVPAFQEGFLDAVFIQHVCRKLTRYAMGICPVHVHLDSNIRSGTNCIYRAEILAGRMAVEHLAELGYRRFIYLGIKPWKDCHVNLFERYEGCSLAAEELGLGICLAEVDFDIDERREKINQLRKCLDPETAVIAAGQELAQYFANELAAYGLCPGRDYALFSCSEKLGCGGVWPGLSRVSFDRIGLGVAAADMMLQLLGGECGKTCPTVFVKGEIIKGSTARPL